MRCSSPQRQPICSVSDLPPDAFDRQAEHHLVAHAADGGEVALQADGRHAGAAPARATRHRARRASSLTQSSTRLLSITRYCGKKTMPAGSQCAKRMRTGVRRGAVALDHPPLRSRKRCSLPVSVRGSVVAELDRARILVGRDASASRSPAVSVAMARRRLRRPGFSTTKALTIWPRSSSGTPTTRALGHGGMHAAARPRPPARRCCSRPR